MPSASIIITIDGPAASGKTSVSRSLATRHNWSWVSTGAFYRGLAFVATSEGVSLDDEEALAKLCISNVWQVKMADDQTQVWLRERDVTSQIYSEENGSVASRISGYPKVRANLLAAQRNCANNVTALVAEGRDCGTVVFPNAKVKIFITARSESRAARRASEQGKDVEATRAAQVIRDKQDSSRQAAPMQVPPNAHVIDTSELSLEATVDFLDQIVRKELEI